MKEPDLICRRGGTGCGKAFLTDAALRKPLSYPDCHHALLRRACSQCAKDLNPFVSLTDAVCLCNMTCDTCMYCFIYVTDFHRHIRRRLNYERVPRHRTSPPIPNPFPS